METHYEYGVHALCSGARRGVVHAEEILPSISFSAPPEFSGKAGRWTPQHFLVASVASCFVATFSGIAEKSGLEFSSFELGAQGMLVHSDSRWRFKQIRLSPVVTVSTEADRDRALRLLGKAERSCLIAQALRCEIVLLPVAKIEEELLVPAAEETDLTDTRDTAT
ncbi:MAG TPA: OsmC family protein [Candidatus Cybelea sp.]|nr:OsmC family protein [Candidatus Cybelea sp.]